MSCVVAAKRFITRLTVDQAGATAIEYGLLASLIAIAAIQALTSVGNEVNTTFETAGSTMGAANGGSADEPSPAAAQAI